MLIIPMPTTSLIQRLYTLLKILYRHSLKRSRNSMSHTRINFPIPKNGCGMYEERLKNVILRDSVQDGEMLGTKLDDGHCFTIVACDFASYTELGTVVNCGFEDGDCGAGEE